MQRTRKPAHPYTRYQRNIMRAGWTIAALILLLGVTGLLFLLVTGAR
jgi:hypothetical protein